TSTLRRLRRGGRKPRRPPPSLSGSPLAKRGRPRGFVSPVNLRSLGFCSGSQWRRGGVGGVRGGGNSVCGFGVFETSFFNHSWNASHSDENDVTTKPNRKVTGAKSLFRSGRT